MPSSRNLRHSGMVDRPRAGRQPAALDPSRNPGPARGRDENQSARFSAGRGAPNACAASSLREPERNEFGEARLSLRVDGPP